MGKNLKGKECGKGIYQRKDGLYSARYYAKNGKRKEKYFETLPEAKNWLADASIKTTMDRYVHVTDESLVNAIRQFQQATPPVTKKRRKKGVQEI